MCKRAHRKSNKFMIQLLAVILICVMLPMQAFAAEVNSVDVAMPEKIETNDWTDVSEEENDLPGEESLTGTEVIAQEESIITASEQIFEIDPTEEDTIWLKGADEEVSPLENCIVAFDPDDGKTGYNDFYKVTVPKGSTVTDQPDNPTRDGYIFKGWYHYLNEEGNPVLWDFKSDTVTENTTLWAAWEEACLVVFDPDDGKTGYNDFYKVTVPKGSTVTDQPENPTRGGYIFKGWYHYLNEEGNPVLWDFKSDTVTENTTLWAAWEEACLVVFDPDDGKTGYNDFYKVTVPKGSTVTDQPETPIREGYIFKGWYSYLNENDNPVLWDFKSDTVTENTTLWAAWEEACLVVFDPDDGKTDYKDFYKVTVPKGSTVTDQPEDPMRDGYIFKGWYSYLDEKGNPVLWDFKSDIVIENTTLWAAWEKETNGGNGEGNGGNGEENGGENGGNGGGNGSDGNSGNGGGYNYIKTGNKTSPGRFINQGNIPKTGDSISMLLWMFCGVSVSGMIILSIVRNKKSSYIDE